MSPLREVPTRCLQSLSRQCEKQPKHSTIKFRTAAFTVLLYQVTISQLFQQHALCNDCKRLLSNKIIFQQVSALYGKSLTLTVTYSEHYSVSCAQTSTSSVAAAPVIRTKPHTPLAPNSVVGELLISDTETASHGALAILWKLL